MGWRAYVCRRTRSDGTHQERRAAHRTTEFGHSRHDGEPLPAPTGSGLVRDKKGCGRIVAKADPLPHTGRNQGETPAQVDARSHRSTAYPLLASPLHASGGVVAAPARRARRAPGQEVGAVARIGLGTRADPKAADPDVGRGRGWGRDQRLVRRGHRVLGDDAGRQARVTGAWPPSVSRALPCRDAPCGRRGPFATGLPVRSGPVRSGPVRRQAVAAAGPEHGSGPATSVRNMVRAGLASR